MLVFYHLTALDKCLR